MEEEAWDYSSSEDDDDYGEPAPVGNWRMALRRLEGRPISPDGTRPTSPGPVAQATAAPVQADPSYRPAQASVPMLDSAIRQQGSLMCFDDWGRFSLLLCDVVSIERVLLCKVLTHGRLFLGKRYVCMRCWSKRQSACFPDRYLFVYCLCICVCTFMYLFTTGDDGQLPPDILAQMDAVRREGAIIHAAADVQATAPPTHQATPEEVETPVEEEQPDYLEAARQALLKKAGLTLQGRVGGAEVRGSGGFLLAVVFFFCWWQVCMCV